MYVTNQEFINEFVEFDELYNVLESTEHDIDIAMADFQIASHRAEMKRFFEGTTDDYMTEGAGLLATIGNSIIAVIKKIGDIIKNVFDVILQKSPTYKTDAEIVTKMIKEHPELGDQIIHGIKREWFTTEDVAKYNKDLIGLVKMLDAEKLSHETFMDKFRRKCKEFAEKNKPLKDAAVTLKELVSFLPNMVNGCKKSKEALQETRKVYEDFKTKVERNYTENDASKARSVLNALGQVLGVTNKEAERSAESMTKAGKALHDAARKQRSVKEIKKANNEVVQGRVRDNNRTKIINDISTRNLKNKNGKPIDKDSETSKLTRAQAIKNVSNPPDKKKKDDGKKDNNKKS